MWARSLDVPPGTVRELEVIFPRLSNEGPQLEGTLGGEVRILLCFQGGGRSRGGPFEVEAFIYGIDVLDQIDLMLLERALTAAWQLAQR